VVVRGAVQGVGFRAACAGEAHRLGVAGWVRNREDGSVEAELQGPATAVERLIGWLRVGPAGARVEEVEVRCAPTEPGVEGFRIAR
jgi:acylphosphatase